ncbi:hypothetical protein SAMN04489724_2892 [Algoriphagus locisalis]|uniref:Uncharacterized protein n=1 Tax=Algoriphagus locisalis TaxID=305507 RepID=A0A1I7BZR3_9BACT|nr:hypothetical protein [Algoriphagus locisalis]SFT92650.1 hypothetical protein SAMN04489724_2892 [Algoriphagus locisalis]
MYKKQIAFFLGLIWLVSFSAFMSFPTHAAHYGDQEDGISTLSESVAPTIHLLGSFETPKTPPFSVDWTVWAKFNSQWSSLDLALGQAFLQPSFFRKSLPLFDVKETFMQFFYTW